MFWRNNRPEISLLQHDVAHITFSVRNGKALLRPSVIHDPDSDAGIHTLSWHGSPLIRFYTEAWCPTCAEFVYAGFSNDDEGAAEFLSSLAEWNQPGVGLNEAFTALTPLFILCGLLTWTITTSPANPVFYCQASPHRDLTHNAPGIIAISQRATRWPGI